MKPPIDILTIGRVADLLDFPRGGGRKQSYGGRMAWGRLRRSRKDPGTGARGYVHRVMSQGEFKACITRGDPVAAAVLRLEIDEEEWQYRYQPTVSFFPIDFDVKDGLDLETHERATAALFDALEWLYERYIEVGIAPGLTHSGSKGWHLWCFLDEEINWGYVAGLFRGIMPGCPGGFVEKGDKWVLEGEGEDGSVIAEIDSLYKTGDGPLIKVPFSAHISRPGRFEVPVRIDDARDYDPDDIEWGEAIAVVSDWRETRHDLITDAFPCLERIAARGPKMKRSVYHRSGGLPLWSPGEIDRAVMAEIDKLTDRGSKLFLPCFDNAVRLSKSKQVPFHLRTVVSRLIELRGWTREHAAQYIQYRINDAEDNANPSVLSYQVQYWAQNHLGKAAHCTALQNPGWTTFCCPAPCGRANPLQAHPLGTTDPVLNIPEPTGMSLDEILDRARALGHDLQIYKTTRAGGTSTIIANTIRAGERVTVIVPSTKIAETAEEAIGLSGVDDIAGALYPGNGESCLKLKQRIGQLRDDFGHGPDRRVATDYLNALFKFPCRTCEYSDSLLQINGGDVIRESVLNPPGCHHATVVNNLHRMSIMVLTHKKLYATIASVDAGTKSAHIDATLMDANRILEWICESDVILLDEISTYIDAPDLDQKVYEIPVGETEPQFSIVDKIESELNDLDQYHGGSVVIRALTDMFEGLVDEFRAAEELDDDLWVYDRDQTVQEERVIMAYMRELQGYALRFNEAYPTVFKSMSLLTEKRWIVVRVPGADFDENIHIYTVPRFQYGIADTLAGSGARLIAMDATMPLVAAHHIDEVIGRKFQRFNIGDPQDSAEHMRIIPWPVAVHSQQLLHPWRGVKREKIVYDSNNQLRPVELELLGLLRLVDRLFGLENVLVAVSSKRVARVVKSLLSCHDRQLVKKLDMLWHRGSDSLGVKNDKRIMIGLTAPYAPQGVHSWIKRAVYPELLGSVPDELLWKYDRNKTDYQTLSRAKDPAFGDPVRRSVYIAYGQTVSEVEQMRQMVVCPPKQVVIASPGRFINRWLCPVLVSYWWVTHGEVLTLDEQRVASLAWHWHYDLGRSVDMGGVLRSLRPVHCKLSRAEDIGRLLGLLVTAG